MISATFSSSDFTPSGPLGAGTYSQSLEVTPSSLSIRASHGTALEQQGRLPAWWQDLQPTKPSVRQEDCAACLAAIYSALSLWLQPSARRNLNLNAAASEISLEKYTGSLQQRASLAESEEPRLGWDKDTQADTVQLSRVSGNQTEINFLLEGELEPAGEAVALLRKVDESRAWPGGMGLCQKTFTELTWRMHWRNYGG